MVWKPLVPLSAGTLVLMATLKEEGTTTGLSFTYDRDSLYRAKYTDGDHENLDQEEYNYAYSLYLKRGGWTPMEVEDYGSDSYHSKKSDSTHAEVPEHPRYYSGFFTWKDIAGTIRVLKTRWFRGLPPVFPSNRMLYALYSWYFWWRHSRSHSVMSFQVKTPQ